MFTQLKFSHIIPPQNNHIKTTYKFTCNVQNDVALPSQISMLRLTRLNLNHQNRRQTTVNHRPNSALHHCKPAIFSPEMTDATEKTENQPPQLPQPPPPAAEEEKVLEKPTPPEKPEAGDCCGSGCVRCVWDIYYDELEDYNRLLQEYNDNSSKRS